ncbi:hypothetical protein H072_8773 [Dactylellina haptotyla CBS 200.50]|uniref:F-box domain-containing protein n=1 Tax=Dactylellina haptotyla (strain CBS 200.50) TaxID=1284197 RepID=S8BE14_DACHA|nr:hypothetical protein H072_8773 [Dactylellina haptotyla CBS 200.50]
MAEPTNSYSSASDLPVEILELILLNVPPLSLITNFRLVCKTWNSLLETSASLKYYATTGLYLDCAPKPSDRPSRISNLPIVTPLAFDILEIFWRKLIQITIDLRTKAEFPISDDNEANPSSNKESSHPELHLPVRPHFMALETLYLQFLPLSSKYPLLHPSLQLCSYISGWKNYRPFPLISEPIEIEEIKNTAFHKSHFTDFVGAAILPPSGATLQHLCADLCHTVHTFQPQIGYSGYVAESDYIDEKTGNIKAYVVFKIWVSSAEYDKYRWSQVVKFANYPPYRPCWIGKSNVHDFRVL